jgi:hypothetical protein
MGRVRFTPTNVCIICTGCPSDNVSSSRWLHMHIEHRPLLSHATLTNSGMNIGLLMTYGLPVSVNGSSKDKD